MTQMGNLKRGSLHLTYLNTQNFKCIWLATICLQAEPLSYQVDTEGVHNFIALF